MVNEAFLNGTGFREKLEELKVNMEHPVWPFLEEYLQEKYHISLANYVSTIESDEESLTGEEQ